MTTCNIVPYILKRQHYFTIVLLSFVLGLNITNAQTVLSFNAFSDVEFSKAGEKSHYYYNEIDQDKINTRLGISNINLLGKLKFNTNWSINTRILLERDKGRKLEKFIVPELNVRWLSKNRKVTLTLGSFANPFGSFNEKQLSIKRKFIGLPLAYSYYTNISTKIGFVKDLGDKTKIPIDGEVQWGSSLLYYGGYTAGASMSWNIKPSKVVWKLAFVNGASNQQSQFSNPINWGVISRLKLQPTYFWEQGLSFSHGTFLESDIWNQVNSYQYSQTLLGTDFKVGKGYIEISGELIRAFYQVPQFNFERYEFEGYSWIVSSLSAYLDLKYELPILPGSYVAYRIDRLAFGELDSKTAQHWDNNVQRHTIAIGYHINKYLLARVGISTQQVDNKEWDKKQRTFRFVLTAHY